MSLKQRDSSGAESSAEDNISPIVSQETYQFLQSSVPIGLDIPSLESEVPRSGSQSDRDEFTKLVPPARKNGDGSRSQVEEPSCSGSLLSNDVNLSRFTDIEGRYKFCVQFQEPNEPPSKAVPWTFSSQLNKLFVQFNVPCPVQISSQVDLPEGCVIRATPHFKEAQNAYYVVERCLTHQRDKEPSNIGFRDVMKHVIRCDSPGASYQRHPVSGRLSVVAPYRRPEAPFVVPATLNYYFVCFSSCTGGMNRRAINVVLTLERGNQILGQRYFEVRICACPGRDRAKLEKKAIKREERNRQLFGHDLNLKRSVLLEPSSLSEEAQIPPPKKAKTDDEDDCHTVSISFDVRGRRNRDVFQRILESIRQSASALESPAIREIKKESEEE